MAKRKLTLKQRKFVDAYLISGNASEAARQAGYSVKTAGSIGEENLKKPAIADAIKAAGEKAAEMAGVTQAWVMQRLQEEAELGLRSGIPPEDVRMRCAPTRVAALNILTRCMGMQITKSENKTDINLTMETDGARDELAAQLALVAQRRRAGSAAVTHH